MPLRDFHGIYCLITQAKEDFSDSYVSVSLASQKGTSSKEHESDVMWTAASLYTGGADTVRVQALHDVRVI